MSQIQAVTNATIVEGPSTGGRIYREWELTLTCGHTDWKPVKYRPTGAARGHVQARAAADAIPAPKHVRCGDCAKGAPRPPVSPAPELTFMETEAGDSVSGALVHLASLAEHRPTRIEQVLSYTRDGLTPAAVEVAEALAGVPALRRRLDTAAAALITLLGACADAGHGHHPIQSAHRVDVATCPICHTVRTLDPDDHVGDDRLDAFAARLVADLADVIDTEAGLAAIKHQAGEQP